MSAAEASEFGPPTDFSAPGGSHAARSSAALSSVQPSGTTYGFRPEPAAQPGATSAYPGLHKIDSLSSAPQPPQASSAAPQMSYRALEAEQAGQMSGMGRASYGLRSARELSFEGEPAPQWELSIACAPPTPGRHLLGRIQRQHAERAAAAPAAAPKPQLRHCTAAQGCWQALPPAWHPGRPARSGSCANTAAAGLRPSRGCMVRTGRAQQPPKCSAATTEQQASQSQSALTFI